MSKTFIDEEENDSSSIDTEYIYASNLEYSDSMSDEISVSSEEAERESSVSSEDSGSIEDESTTEEEPLTFDSDLERNDYIVYYLTEIEDILAMIKNMIKPKNN